MLRGSSELFTNAVHIRGRFADKNAHQPKPDFWFGLALYDDEQLSRLKGLELADKGIRHFAQTNLEETSQYRNDAFVYQPVKSKGNAAFPWMVGELKPEEGDEDYCLRQAANASHMCLVLYERLAELAARDGPPIVAFTSIGPQAKVFITYKSGTAENYCYVCFSLTSTYRFPILPHQLADNYIHLSECLAYGVAKLETCCMPFNFGALLINLCSGH